MNTKSDIAESTLLRERLRDSENLAERLLAGLKQGIFLKDLNSTYVSVNQSYCSLTAIAVRPEEVAGKTDFDFYPRELADKYRSDDKHVMESGQSREIEDLVRRPDGTEITVQVIKTPFRNHEGEIVGLLGIFWDITEQKRLTNQLHLVSDLVKQSTQPFVVVDMLGRIILCNHSYEDLTGYTRDELQSMTYQQLTPSKWHEFEAEQVKQLLTSGHSVHYEKEYLRKDGSAVPIEITVDVYRDQNQQPAYLYGFLADLTERKRMENRIRSEKARMQAMLDGLPAMICLLTADWTVRFANMAYRKQFGEPNGRKCYDYCFGKAAPCEWCESSQVLQTATPHDWELHTPQGEWFHIFDTPFEDSDGSPLVLKMKVDVTRQRQAEATLRESEKKFSTLADFVPQLVWMCTPDGMSVYFNRRWQDYTGMSLEASYGRGWDTPFHPDDKQAAWNAWNHAVATGELYRVESRLRAADGTYRWFLMRGTPMRNEDGSIVRWFGTCTDIEDLKQAEEKLRTMNEELDMRVRERTAELTTTNKELEAFTYAVAHDLRAPLRHIHGFADLLGLETDSALSPQSRQYLRRIQDGAEHMGHLLEDLLELSRMGRLEVQKRECDLKQLASEVISDLQNDCKGRRIHWKIGDLPRVDGDVLLIKRLLTNLLSNAVKFTRPRDPAFIEIDTTTTSEGERVVYVRDNGVGFDMRYSEKLCKVFQRLHRQEDFEGTGVGLAIVQQVAHKHGGRIWAEAALDKGATFFFTLAGM